MKIALINPPMSMEQQYGSLKELSPELPLLGIAFIASYLKKKEIEVDLLDHANLSFDESISELKKYQIVGFSSYIINYNIIINICNQLKKTQPNIITVVGGPHATLFPNEFHDSKVDYIIVGEGEIPFLELIQSIKNNIKPSAKGIVDFNSSFFEYTKSDIINDIDSIGRPLVEKYNLSQYYPPAHICGKKVIHTLTSRGCPFKCSFCAASEVMGRKIRYRSIKSVVEEIEFYMYEYGYDSVMFYDDIFTLNRNRVLDFCNEIVKKNIKFKWSCFTRTQCIDVEMCSAMKQSGCYLITFGCESANNKTLTLLNKGLTHEINISGIDIASNAGLYTCSSFMIGLPGENENDINRTIEFASKSKLTFAVFPIFEPFKGTPIYEVCNEMGEWVKFQNENNFMLVNQEDVWVPYGMKREEITLLARKAFQNFYFNPLRLAKLLTYSMFRLPPSRSFSFLKGGCNYFLKYLNKDKSQHYTHY